MKILIVDDDRLVVQSLKIILEAAPEIEVDGTGYSGGEAVDLYYRHRPDILLMDIRMEGMSGLEAGEKILNSDPGAQILFLTTFSDDEYIVKALKIGARGYLLKQNFADIAPALRVVHSGQSVFGGPVISKIPGFLNRELPTESRSPKTRSLSDREWEVAAQVAEGLSNREIARKLYLSEGTVRNYISTILEKLRLRDRTQLAVFCLKR